MVLRVDSICIIYSPELATKMSSACLRSSEVVTPLLFTLIFCKIDGYNQSIKYFLESSAVYDIGTGCQEF